jgi:hypothetical protein
LKALKRSCKQARQSEAPQPEGCQVLGAIRVSPEAGAERNSTVSRIILFLWIKSRAGHASGVRRSLGGELAVRNSLVAAPPLGNHVTPYLLFLFAGGPWNLLFTIGDCLLYFWFRPRLEQLYAHVLCSCEGHWRYAFFFVFPVFYQVCLCVFP